MKLRNDLLEVTVRGGAYCSISNIYCMDCNEVLGWKYEQVVEPSQKYKKEKFVLELCKIADINYVDCNEVLGWKYEQAVEAS
ncbi:hypothetical protein R3W88_016900 [Solanum pinnatisectum]|uniref:Protein yippee-like n=1 Tax=Solanum pinnatisectum TaxID=50273 RepID=A0AAV9KZT9_9SOLN|nr:hypothetical protein R3W88_016900 [Solanum pinnatisectum]